MASFLVVLVGPKSEGNVGAVARAMRNFGVEELVLVAPPPLGDEAKERAMHAWDVVQRARHAATVEDALVGCDYVVGTSGKIPASEKAHLRNPVNARDLPRRLADVRGRVGLLFGREDFGLFNSELELCDLVVTIPSSGRYPSLNLSHAVAVLLYELYVYRHPEPVKALRPMNEAMRRTFYETFDLLVDQLGLPAHKVRGTKIVYRRLFGRAVPSAWEFFVLMGILSRVLRKYGIDVESGRFDGAFDLPEGAEEEIRALFAAGAGEPPLEPAGAKGRPHGQ